MVTFALPGDNDAGDAGSSTPKSRPGLAFSQRGFAASPYGSVGKRAGSSTPLGGSIRKSFIARSEPPASSLGRSFAGQRNIFRASAISDSPPTANTFSPSVPQSTMKRVFAPGATPEPSRTARELGAQSATRGVAARAKDKDLFPMRISSPPPELTGEALAQKVPKDWDPKGSIYADQFLAHLAPAEFDEDQRRQFFCILDLRRLKYAADEIFVKKGWKLNVMNFAKEFEKSRSIILLRYGLYEFQNVKPSKEILKRWRREHGLPDPEEEAESTPTKTTSKKKRKATDDGEGLSTPALKSKKRDLDTDTPVAPFAAATAPSTTPAAAPPAASKNKRKASLGEEAQAPPAKVQRPTSGARTLFEQAANKASSTPSTTPAKPSFSSAKPATNNLMRSVLKSEAAQAASSTNGNIFGYLSDNSSAKNSGVDADAESESDSEESPEAEQADERSAKRPALTSTVDTPSDAGTRESTPGRSLFDRITRDEGGQPVRATTPLEPAPAALKDQTWKPDATPSSSLRQHPPPRRKVLLLLLHLPLHLSSVRLLLILPPLKQRPQAAKLLHSLPLNRRPRLLLSHLQLFKRLVSSPPSRHPLPAFSALPSRMLLQKSPKKLSQKRQRRMRSRTKRTFQARTRHPLEQNQLPLSQALVFHLV
ncbi:hypothetical protein V2G26_003426 [Clonostachys chloroleuca]